MSIELLTILALAVFVGFEVISKVSSILHTPLMSGANAIQRHRPGRGGHRGSGHADGATWELVVGPGRGGDGCRSTWWVASW